MDAFEDLIEIKGNDDHSKLIAMLDELNDYSIPITQIMDRWFCRENLFSCFPAIRWPLLLQSYGKC